MKLRGLNLSVHHVHGLDSIPTQEHMLLGIDSQEPGYEHTPSYEVDLAVVFTSASWNSRPDMLSLRTITTHSTETRLAISSVTQSRSTTAPSVFYHSKNRIVIAYTYGIMTNEHPRLVGLASFAHQACLSSKHLPTPLSTPQTDRPCSTSSPAAPP